MQKVYDDWVTGVRANVPAKQLLVHKATDSYKPICEFLNLHDRCPDDAYDYPHLNKNKDDMKQTDSMEKVSEVTDCAR